ncbi:gliding motility-associated C-terminal domain-containing protein [Cyclobacterium jeungdonense]|uniref:Gliding motility-associated C-terminal domain-containing protein n=1 Tax=Cyclobacterium jeungdonense TaxID=708087 RepID=A0ABT8CAS1_9BACT|nr:gliding motility-associated C-terminal domain-containing protein [Cyclobacterium jeungdonense]MDN3689899.1 gliding motility-associated C-terminal domain-containing protein [Cyclobacterium jeungdonense]
MKNFLVLILILSFFRAKAQELTLAGNAILSIKEAGMTVSTPSIQLRDKSRLIHPAGIQLRGSTYIQLSSPEARIITNELSPGSAYEMEVGINSKTIVHLTAHQEGSAYALGMQSLPSGSSLPFTWSIDPIFVGKKPETNLFFGWEEAIEPKPFVLKALMSKSEGDWQMLPVPVTGTSVVYEKYSEWSESNQFTIKTNTKDSDFDEVPDVQELLEITNWNNTGNYLDSDGDGVPDYIEMLDQTNPHDEIDFVDSNSDGISDYIYNRSLISILENLEKTVSWGDTSWSLDLPDSVLAMTGNGRLEQIPVHWKLQMVDIFRNGSYKVNGQIDLANGIFNPFEIVPELSVEVLPKAGPEDILLSSMEFTVVKDSYSFEVGDFSVVDGFDDMHWIKLLDEGYDNLLFEIKGSTLFWKSDSRAEGRTKFTIIVRVKDRDGNVLDKFFEITRHRPDINDILVNNTFSPNGDGINDTWGVPELRFFSGVRIQVFERSGRRVFYTENPDERWDGTWNGKTLSVGTYFWTIEIREFDTIRSGILNLLKD